MAPNMDKKYKNGINDFSIAITIKSSKVLEVLPDQFLKIFKTGPLTILIIANAITIIPKAINQLLMELPQKMSFKKSIII